jgi:hypothetical protein
MTIESFCDGKVVVVRNSLSNSVPLFCKMCDFPMISSDDCISYRRIGVCSRCSGRWEHTKGSQLKDGVFPDKTSEEWTEYMEERKATSVRIIDIR